jgi:hypothetical protein
MKSHCDLPDECRIHVIWVGGLGVGYSVLADCNMLLPILA